MFPIAIDNQWDVPSIQNTRDNFTTAALYVVTSVQTASVCPDFLGSFTLIAFLDVKINQWHAF